MSHDQNTTRPPDQQGNSGRSPNKLRLGTVLIGFLAIVGLLLVYEHRVHIFTGNGVLIALLALCVGMHFLMHGGHGGHGGHGDGEKK